LHVQDLTFGNNISFDVNQCGQVTTINAQAAILTTIYYFPLLALLVLIATKVSITIKEYHNKWLVNN